MYYLVNPNLAIGSSKKVMSSSVGQALQGNPLCTKDWLMKHKDKVKVIVIIRNPIDRLKSAYRFFKDLTLNGIAYEEFVDQVLTNLQKNEHWSSQYDEHSVNGNLIVDIFIDINNLSIIKEYVDINFPKKNQTFSRTPDYRNSDVEKFYEDDMSLLTMVER